MSNFIFQTARTFGTDVTRSVSGTFLTPASIEHRKR